MTYSWFFYTVMRRLHELWGELPTLRSLRGQCSMEGKTKLQWCEKDTQGYCYDFNKQSTRHLGAEMRFIRKVQANLDRIDSVFAKARNNHKCVKDDPQKLMSLVRRLSSAKEASNKLKSSFALIIYTGLVAQDLLYKMVKNHEAGILLISEQYRHPDDIGWHSEHRGDTGPTCR